MKKELALVLQPLEHRASGHVWIRLIRPEMALGEGPGRIQEGRMPLSVKFVNGVGLIRWGAPKPVNGGLGS